MSRNQTSQERKNLYWHNIVYSIINKSPESLGQYLKEISQKEGGEFLITVLNTKVTIEGAEYSMPYYCFEASKSIYENNLDLDPLLVMINQKQKADLLIEYGANSRDKKEINDKYLDAIFHRIKTNIKNNKPKALKNIVKTLKAQDPDSLKKLLDDGINIEGQRYSFLDYCLYINQESLEQLEIGDKLAQIFVDPPTNDADRKSYANYYYELNKHLQLSKEEITSFTESESDEESLSSSQENLNSDGIDINPIFEEILNIIENQQPDELRYFLEPLEKNFPKSLGEIFSKKVELADGSSCPIIHYCINCHSENREDFEHGMGLASVIGNFDPSWYKRRDSQIRNYFECKKDLEKELLERKRETATPSPNKIDSGFESPEIPTSGPLNRSLSLPDLSENTSISNLKKTQSTNSLYL